MDTDAVKAKTRKNKNTMATETNGTPYRWIFRGTIVVPFGHPFPADSTTSNLSTEQELSFGQEWVGENCYFLKFLHDHILAVDHQGIIQALQPAEEFLNRQGGEMIVGGSSIQQLSVDEFLLPGLIDLHIHAAQFSYTGTATDRTLFDWLETYTFPAERKLETDATWAKRLYTDVVRTTLSFGTTTAVYHTTLHLKPCKLLVDQAMSIGQRAVIGKVAMDRNSPDDYQHSTEQNIAESIELIDYIGQKAGHWGHNEQRVLPLILPMVTPRFIPTCSPALLEGLGKVAKAYDCFISTHISEGLEEVAYTKDCDVQDHGQGRTGTQILQSHGLLSDKCILAHCVHIDDDDAATLRRFKSGVAHCPLSNFFFAKGTFPCRKLLQAGNRIGLGTDVAGGYSPSLWASQRDTVIASQCLANGEAMDALDYRHSLWLATLGGAMALGLENRIGTFAVGMEFDAIIMSPKGSPIRFYPSDTAVDKFQKLCCLGDDRNVKRVFVQGREIALSANYA